MNETIQNAIKNGQHVSAGPDKGSQECVALVKAVRPDLGPTKDWKAGDPVAGNASLKPGDALGTGFDKDGNYPSNSTGNHAVVVTEVKRDPQGNITSVKIAEQWAARPGRNGQGSGRDPMPTRERDLTPEEIDEYRVIGRKK